MSLNLHIKEIIYRILQKHSKRLKFAHFCSGSPFAPKRHISTPKFIITVFPPFDLPFVPQCQNFQSLLAQMPSVKKIFQNSSFNVKANSLHSDKLKYGGGISRLFHFPPPRLVQYWWFLCVPPFDCYHPPSHCRVKKAERVFPIPVPPVL